jgi:hypothetical protein
MTIQGDTIMTHDTGRAIAVGGKSSQCASAPQPMKEVAGKVAFVTGGSSGIGLGIARAFADAGMKVVIGYRTSEHLAEAMKYLEGASGRVHAVNVDVTDRSGMQKAADEIQRVFGKIHVLVNNAGVVLPATLAKTTYDDWDFLMRVNLDGVFNGVRVFLPLIQRHGEGGQIITTSSILGLFVLGAGEGAYCKPGIDGGQANPRGARARARAETRSAICDGPPRIGADSAARDAQQRSLHSDASGVRIHHARPERGADGRDPARATPDRAALGDGPLRVREVDL